jgi:hypothetical protein
MFDSRSWGKPKQHYLMYEWKNLQGEKSLCDDCLKLICFFIVFLIRLIILFVLLNVMSTIFTDVFQLCWIYFVVIGRSWVSCWATYILYLPSIQQYCIYPTIKFANKMLFDLIIIQKDSGNPIDTSIVVPVRGVAK